MGLMGERGSGEGGKGSRKNDFQQGRRGIASVCLMLRFALHFDSSLFTLHSSLRFFT